MNCPICGTVMERGWLALYDPIIFTRMYWQSTKPGYIRLRPPAGAVKVIQPRVGGGGSPEAYICKQCKLSTFRYDQEHTT
jgi:hypothetical protein